MVSAGARDKMLDSAARLLAQDGLEGTSFATVLADSGAPRGSIYHHFPGGKDELVAEAVRGVGSRVSALVAELRDGDPTDPEAVVRRFAAPWRQVLTGSGMTAGCAVAAVAVGGGPELRPVVEQVFGRWRDGLAQALGRTGLDRAAAARLATTVIAAVEGALVLSRAEGDPAAFDSVVEDLVDLARLHGPR